MTPGLTAAQVAAARAAGKVNRSTTETSRSFGHILRANLVTRFNLLLGALGVVVIVVGPLRDAMFLGVVAANAFIGVVQEWRATRTLDRLRLLSAPTVVAWRDGRPDRVAAEDLVLGDVIELGRGDQVPVDGTVLDADGFELDTSLLTGEAEPEQVNAGDTVRAGTIVVAGTATVETTGVGADRLASRIEAEARRFDLAPSELRRTTDRLLQVITWAIVVLGPILVLRQALGPENWREGVRGTVAGMVSMVPEGLVLLTSATLALGAIRLGRRRVLVQELPAIELLARVDTLCLDKTGTITTGQPRLSAVLPTRADVDPAELSMALGALARTDPNPNLTLAAILAAHPEDPAWPVAHVVPFSSQRRWGGARFAEHGTWVLGAPDVLEPAGTLPAATAGQRVVALGRGDTDLRPDELPTVDVVAHVVLAEQVRPTAPATLGYLREQGVRLKVVSGDHPATVAAVAMAAGWDVRGAVDARQLPDDGEGLVSLVDGNDVLGRVEPHGKQRLVRALRGAGHTVGMTGDGVNDVLALKEADLAMAMGSGSAAARSVSELVLLDDDFDVVPLIVDEGRRVLANVERVSVFFLTKTVWACVLATVVAVSGMPYPLYASQATLVGFLSIGLPAFLLSFRRHAPRARPGILTRIVRRALPMGAVSGAAGAAVFAISHHGLGHSTAAARSATALTLTAISLVIVTLNLGPRPGRWRWLPGGLAVAGALIVAVPALRGWFSLEDPTAADLGLVGGFGFAGGVAVVLASRWAGRRSSSH